MTSAFTPGSYEMMNTSEVCSLTVSRSLGPAQRCSAALMGTGIVQSLQDLHDMLREYHPPEVAHPRAESREHLSPWSLRSWFGAGGPKKTITSIPANLPKGLYMYGDVGSGKTMLMDMFYDTLPSNIRSKTRTHFHNFMQDVHKRLHAMKAELGSDLDAIKFVAADIAEKGSVLCFDEFQCTDVADAMILRRFVGLRPSLAPGLTRSQLA